MRAAVQEAAAAARRYDVLERAGGGGSLHSGLCAHPPEVYI